MKAPVRLIAAIISFFLLSTFMFCQNIDLAKLNSSIKEAEKIINTDSRIFFKNIRSLIISKDGKTIHEGYYNGHHKDSIRIIQSQTKSIVALLMGIAIDNGFIKDENELAAKYFPEYFDRNDTLKSSIRIKDLLTMSSGMLWEEWIPFNDPKNDNINMFNSGDWLNYALTRPMAAKPFTEFKYNSGSPMIIAAIIQKATGMTLEAFTEKYLFKPLGIKTYSWQKDSKNFPHAGGGLLLKPADMITIGELVLFKGKWGNTAIISSEWIEKISKPYFFTTLRNYYYGYYWWIHEGKINTGKSTRIISAQGAGGQYMYIIPEYNLVVGFTEDNMNNPLVGDLIMQNVVLPSLK